MFDNNRTNSLDVLPSLIAALCWGAMFPIAASALHHVDPFPLTAIRYGVAAIVFLGLLYAIEGRKALAPAAAGSSSSSSARSASPASTCSRYVGLEHTRPQDAALIVASQPLLMVLALWLIYKQAPARTTLAAMGVALLGVDARDLRGHSDAAQRRRGRPDDPDRRRRCWVVYTLGARRFPEFSPLRYTAISAGCGTLTILAATAVAVGRLRAAARRRTT